MMKLAVSYNHTCLEADLPADAARGTSALSKRAAKQGGGSKKVQSNIGISGFQY